MRRYVLAPRPDHERHAQDYFVHDLMVFHGLTLLRNRKDRFYEHHYPDTLDAPALIVSHNPDHIADARFITHWGLSGNVPIVVHLHCHFNYFPKAGTSEISKISNRENIASSLCYAHTVIVPAEFMVEDLRMNVPNLRPDLKFEVISNGARASLYYPSTLIQRLKFRKDVALITADIFTRAGEPLQGEIPANKKLVGFVGRIENSKGLQLLQELALLNETEGELSDACLFVQYRFQPELNQYESSAAKAKELREINKNFVWIYPDRAPRSTNRPMRHFDVLLLPSLSEVQPMVVLEALSCGVPVVATRSTRFFDELKQRFRNDEFREIPLPERLLEGSNGIETLESADDPRALAHELVGAINAIPNYDDTQRMLLAQKTELAGFTDATMYKKYLRVYDDVVEDFGKRRGIAAALSQKDIAPKIGDPGAVLAVPSKRKPGA